MVLGSNQLYSGVQRAENVYKECTVLFSLAQNLLTLDRILAKTYQRSALDYRRTLVSLCTVQVYRG